jgi:hypothetical protein
MCLTWVILFGFKITDGLTVSFHKLRNVWTWFTIIKQFKITSYVFIKKCILLNKTLKCLQFQFIFILKRRHLIRTTSKCNNFPHKYQRSGFYWHVDCPAAKNKWCLHPQLKKINATTNPKWMHIFVSDRVADC